MAIKKICSGEKCSPKKWAADMLYRDLDNLTDYYYERWSDEWNEMTESEQRQVSDQINKFHNRIQKILEKLR